MAKKASKKTVKKPAAKAKAKKAPLFPGFLPLIYVSRFFLFIENRRAMSSGRAIALPTDRSTQPRAVDEE